MSTSSRDPALRVTTRAGALLAVLVLAGCAGNAKRDDVVSSEIVGSEPGAVVDVEQQQSQSAPSPTADAPVAASSARTGIDYDPAVYDPWERLNRKTHRFNFALDRRIMKPIARTYVKVTPAPLRNGIGRFFNNLQQPVVALNLALQGRPGRAGQSVGRFALNLTLGVGGIFDPATRAGIPYYKDDFGETFYRWGWQRSRYLVLPVFGPSTLRDGIGRGINSRVSPINRLAREEGAWIGIVYGVHSRASALPSERFMEGAEDDYLMLRDVYYQRRYCQLEDCTQDALDYELPEDLGVDDTAK